MTNKQVINAFFDGHNGYAGNLMSFNDKLMSYNTCIAQRDGVNLYINQTKYSVTTSKHKGMVERCANNMAGYGYKIIHVDDVPINTKDLIKYENSRKS